MEIEASNKFIAEEHEKPWNTSTEEIKELGKEKIESLKEEIEEIENLISERQSLSKSIFLEAEKVKMEINNFLAETHVAVDGNRDKVALKQKQVEISELQLNEKINCWQDIAKLKQELRECKKELAGRQGRMEMLGKILEE